MKPESDSGRLALLYVEDDPDTRELISSSLAEEYPDLALHVAAGGAEGLELFREQRPELVITDIRMPGMDGLRMVREIKAIARETEVIALTAYSDTDFLLSAVELGFSHYVLKPIDFDRLFGAIEKSLQVLNLKRQVNDQNEQIRQFAALLEKRVEERTAKLREMTRDLKASRDRYWNLYNWSPLGYLSIDGEFIIREMNITAARMLGARRTELVGTSLERYLSPENMSLLVESFRDCTEANLAHTEVQITLQERQQLYVQLHCVPYKHHVGERKLYRTAIIDITKLKEAEGKLFRLNRLYSMLSATGKAIAQSAGPDELFQEVCRVAVEEGGFRQACIGLVGGKGDDMCPVAKTNAVAGCPGEFCVCFSEKLAEPCPVTIAIREKSYNVINDCMNDPDAGYAYSMGQQCGFRSTAAFALEMGGKAVGALSMYAEEVDFFDDDMIGLLTRMSSDISLALENMDRERRRREAEEALYRETEEKLKAVEEVRSKERLLIQQNRLAAMGEMLMNIAHQWRQPLNVIGLTVQQLPFEWDAGALDRESLQRSADKTMDVVTRLSETIDQFSTFLQPDKGMQSFRAHDAVTATVALMEAGFREQNIAIAVSGEEGLQMKGYRSAFSQVILNLLMNARDALQERHVQQPGIKIRVFSEEGRTVITVTDNAGGIPEEIIDRVFEPYFTTKGPDKGTGIGLFMSKTIIEKNMGGTLTVRNTEEGAEFRIEV